MAEASIPVDLFNPGQVFACLGFLEAADVLLGDAEAAFDWSDPADVRFQVRARGPASPVVRVLEFLASAEVSGEAPAELRAHPQTARCMRRGRRRGGRCDAGRATRATRFPSRRARRRWSARCARVGTRSPSITGGSGSRQREVLGRIRRVPRRRPGAGRARSGARPRGGCGLRSVRRQRAAEQQLPARLAPRLHSDRCGVLAQRPRRAHRDRGVPARRAARRDRPEPRAPRATGSRNKLEYRYGVVGRERATGPWLPASLLRAALGAARLPLPSRHFRMQLGWPAKENQARAITNVTEETIV